MERIRLTWRELRNYLFIRKLIKQKQEDESWKKFNLRGGWVNQIYTIVSLRKEDMGEDEVHQKMKVLQRMEPINRYIESLDISEIVRPEIVKIPSTRSWLIIYWPIWQYFRPFRLLFYIGIVIGLLIYFL